MSVDRYCTSEGVWWLKERKSVERGMSRPKTIDGSGADKSRREAEISLFSSCAVRDRMVFG